MRISYRWLNRHVDLGDLSAAAVADLLTRHIAEVDGVEAFAPALDQVRVGLVLARAAHPNADRLGLCQVDMGDGEPLAIVCGAPNVAAGQKVAVATVGTVLPGDLVIKQARIRGVESNGMICSERELGLGDEHEGIWVLPAEAPLGAVVSDLFGGADQVIVVDNKAITHRPDLWGHRGIAAELAALLDRPLKALDLTLPPTGDDEAFPVAISTAGCRRFYALPIAGVHAARSPDWLRLLLLAAGQRPLDVLVDISNFVMLDLGQPNHLFDRRQVAAGIDVRQAREGETLVTLDGTERRLTPADILICSGDAPVALAGIMGGEASKVAQDSESLLLEVASFDAATIRRSSSRLGLRTDASSRFEKSLDPALPQQAAAHLVRLLTGIQPELRLPAPPTDVGDWQRPPTVVPLRPARVRQLLGVSLADDEIASILGRLRFGLDRGDSAVWQVTVPSDRATKDVAIEEDLVEEVGRFHGYDAVPETPLRADLAPALPDRRQQLIGRAQDFLAGAPCFHEAYTYSFLDETLAERLGIADQAHSRVVNAVAAGLSRLRRDVAPSLLGLLERNLRQEPDVRLFEVGKGSRPETVDEAGRPAEVEQVALLWAAPRAAAGAPFGSGRQDALKGVVEALLGHLALPPNLWRAATPAETPPWGHPTRSQTAVAADGTALAWLTDLDPAVARRLDVDADVAVAWLSLDALQAQPASRAAFKTLPRYPGVKIDVAIAAPQTVPHGDLAAAIQRSGKGQVAACELFDLYVGEGLGGRRSLAYHVLLQSHAGTLSDTDGARCIARLERELTPLGAELRRG